MYRQSYADILADSTMESRSIERLALDKAIAKLTAAAPAGAGSLEENEALDFTTRLWALFIKDLTSPGNDLPSDVRAGLIRTGLGILSEAQRIRLGVSRDFQGLAEICGIVRDGLG